MPPALLFPSVFLLCWLLGSTAQSSEPSARPLTIYVAGTAGGGIDLYARLLARHIGRHMPGNPSVTVLSISESPSNALSTAFPDAFPKPATDHASTEEGQAHGLTTCRPNHGQAGRAAARPMLECALGLACALQLGSPLRLPPRAKARCGAIYGACVR